MLTRLRYLMIGALLAVGVLALAACTMTVQPAPADHPQEAATAEHGMDAMDHDQADANGQDNHGMTMDSDVPFDALFIDSMIVHHQGAIDMAQAVLDNSQQAELRALAETIIAAQTGEIEEMQAWREAWFPDLPPSAGMDMGMGDMEISDDPAKPFEQRFIEAMISHHQGAIDMAKIALEQGEHEEIRTLAQAIIAAQDAEIEMMRGWLKEWYGVQE